MHESFHIADLIVKKIRGGITPGEQHELEQWKGERVENQELFDRASNPKQQLDRMEVYRLFDKEKVWGQLEEELFGAKTIRFSPRRILRYAAAILLPLMVGGGFAWWYLREPSSDIYAEIDAAFPPGSQRAVLTLSNGEQVELNPEQSASTLYDGDVNISHGNMRISYTSGGQENHPSGSVFNELRTPRGGGYQLLLSDGTMVWLNSGSSLRYPVSFHDSIRQVLLDGEAYFEVSHSETPFVVSTANMSTRVLGTSFNVEAFSDDPAFYTTLVEGRVLVEVSKPGTGQAASVLLEPDQQAIFTRPTGAFTKTNVDASGYTSWMRGKLEFYNASLETVMKRLSRWYDFTYEFENAAARDKHFSARLDKEESISSILKMLEMTTDVKFEFRNERIVVF